MKDFFEILTQFIVINIFISYGLYSIALVVLTLVIPRNQLIEKFDAASNNLIRFSGLVYLGSLVILISLTPPVFSGESYWWGPWLQPVIWIFATQMLWIKMVRHSRIARIVISVLLIISFEKFVVFVTSFHRDYIPSGWTTDTLTPGQWILGFVVKMSIFFVLSLIFFSYKEKVKGSKS